MLSLVGVEANRPILLRYSQNTPCCSCWRFSAPLLLRSPTNLPLAPPNSKKQKIRDKYEPGAADLRAYKKAKAEGKLQEYWAERGETLRQLTGSAEPPTATTTSVAASG